MEDPKDFETQVMTVPINTQKEKTLGNARSRVRTLFYLQAFGQVLSIGGVLAVQMMQTSLNVEGRVGWYMRCQYWTD